ncbi:Uncharacterized protein OBRU01_23712, partial [Operophtera brumata]
DDFYYTPVERSFAQVQPPLYPNNRRPTFIENGGDSFRTAQQPQQPLYTEGHVRFPSPNYNQNPSPFQLPTGRSQSGSSYYVNQPEFTSQRQRFKPALPYNFQLVHPASTKRPDVSQIHSVAYQNDPSKPETFLGQITLNNPDIDYLQNSRFKNLPFDSNSLKSNGQTGHITHDDDVIENENQDLFDQSVNHRVTTYNPNKFSGKQRLNIKPTGSLLSPYTSAGGEKPDFRDTANIVSKNNFNDHKTNGNVYQSSSTEYKALLDLEPLLEDEISDIGSFRELMKNKQGSFDVQVIKSNQTDYSESADDSKPDASSMNTDNFLKEIPVETPTTQRTSTTSSSTTTSHIHHDTETGHGNEEEYVEYYDDYESSDDNHTTQPPKSYSTEHDDIYDEYDSTEEPENTTEESKSEKIENFDVLVMKPGNKTVENAYSLNDTDDGSIPTTTENWVVASVQTSRSVSGARFLPFPTVEQEEKKQVLTDEDEQEEEEEEEDNDKPVTKDPHQEKSSSLASTENINDKLDSIQSELSSSVFSGSLDKDNKNIELITESTTEQSTTTTSTTTTSTTTTTTTTTTPSPPNVFTLKSTTAASFTERSLPDPLPVQIKKFAHRTSTSSTTPKPRKKSSLVTVSDDLTGLLPPGYKPRLSFKDKRTSTTTTTTKAPTTTSEIPLIINETQGRSSGISSKNKVIVLDGKSLLPREYRPKEQKSQEDLLTKLQKDDFSKLLPPGYKLPASEATETKETTKTDIFEKVQQVDISAFLPKKFNLSVTSTEKPKIKLTKLPALAIPVDITALLPPGFKLNSTEKEESLLNKIKVADVSSLLPPGFKLNDTETAEAPEPPSMEAPSSTTKSPGGIKLVFPSRPGGKVNRKTTTTKPMGPPPLAKTIQKGWPTRKDCDIAATIKIVSGVKWVPELLDHHTDEWQRLAKEVKDEINSVYSKSDSLRKWFKGVRIDGFTKGSVLVDYFIELNNVEERIDTLDLKKMFHKSLHEAQPGSVMETIDGPKEEVFDPDAMLGDQPEEERMKKSNEKMTKTIDKSAGKLEIGKFIMDPAYTEFIVLPKREEPTLIVPEEESFLPQWGIAVIVIALASLLFVVIFGVTVLVNRQKSSKAKQPIPLSEEMLRDLDKSHMGGFEDLHPMKERDLPYLPSGKRMSTAFIEQLAYPNPGDSWRSEWTPQLQKYMQHYTPDSGRGSQTYGAAYGYDIL